MTRSLSDVAKVDVVVLAAGKGTRMYSSTPKVLHTIGGKPMAQHVIDAAKRLGDVALHVVVGHQADSVSSALQGADSFVEQREQLGTGHAVAQVLPTLREDAITLILYGDVPLIQTQTLERLVAGCTAQSMTLLTVTLDNPQGYGRICRNTDNEVISIVEQKDADPQQLLINEVNTGIMCIQQSCLAAWLPLLSNTNAQNEYYLTDVVAMAVAQGIGVTSVDAPSPEEVEGVNNKLQLGALERCYQRRLADALMLAGTTQLIQHVLIFAANLVLGRTFSLTLIPFFQAKLRWATMSVLGQIVLLATAVLVTTQSCWRIVWLIKPHLLTTVLLVRSRD